MAVGQNLKCMAELIEYFAGIIFFLSFMLYTYLCVCVCGERGGEGAGGGSGAGVGVGVLGTANGNFGIFDWTVSIFEELVMYFVLRRNNIISII